MTYISTQLLTSTLILDPSNLSSDIDNIIKIKLKEKFEGISYEDGYIVEDSIRIIQRSMGNIVTNNKKSVIKYNIKYKADVISPNENDVIEVYVQNINKLGVIGYIKLKDGDNHENSPLIVMVPKEYFTDDTLLNIEDINVGQKIKVITVGKRVKFNSRNIQVIAKPE